MTKVTYEVTGGVPYQGHQPGETFDAELDEQQERRALERGSITRVGKKAAAKPDPKEASDE